MDLTDRSGRPLFRIDFSREVDWALRLQFVGHELDGRFAKATTIYDV